MSMDATALPSELLVPPQPLIGFCGLDIAKNSVHKTIWDAFSTNRKADRAAVQFKLLPPNYEFPVAKPKRASYEWYQPKGILKRNWMLKHLHVLPGVVVLFQDIEWNDPQWTEKQMQCASQIQSLKHNLQERYTRLALVLLQKAAPLPAGEDLLASERVASLANACSISTKMLFILPYSDHLMGYTLRLESAFLEMAQSYYSQMSKRVRTHRDQLTAAHQTLKIRHQFKMGFISEMRMDYSTALKHYTQAYANLDEIRIVDTNCLEIKTIAGFLNYKICRLMFKLNIPRDSINHFINHIDKYKNRVGFKELLFEHYAWLSTQHSAFAELFCEAIKNGLPALQTQHPGIYFHKAAEYVAKRKEAFLQCSSLSLSPTEPQSPGAIPNPSSFFSEFFGIRTLKTGEPFTEQHVIALVQENERNFNHSATIIYLLGQAMAQFKVYKCLRFRKKLAIDMAEEYYKCGDHAKALTLYSLMLPDYRQDKWGTIFTDVLLKTLRCAFLAASVADFISCSIEALSVKINSEQKERIIVLENLWKVFQSVPPVSQSQIAPELRSNWEAALGAYKPPVMVDLDKLTDLLECFVTFDRAQIKNDEAVNIRLYIKLLTDVPLKVRGFSILLTDGSDIYKLRAIKYNIFDNLTHLRNEDPQALSMEYLNVDSDVKLEPNRCYKIIFSTESHQFLENIHLQVSRIEVEIGTDKIHAILAKSVTLARHSFKNYNRFKDLIDSISINPTCYITPTFHLLTKSMQSTHPMLVNEYFKVISNISNPFNMFLQNVGISISVPNNLKNKVFLATDVTQNKQKLLSHIQMDIGELSMQGSTTVSYYVFSLVEAKIDLQQKVWYTLEVNRSKSSPERNVNDDSPTNGKQLLPDKLPATLSSTIRIDYVDDNRLRKTKDEIITISCVPEFKFVGRFYTLNRQPLVKAYRGENFLFRANVEVQAPCDLDILETYFICDHNLAQSSYSFKRKKYTNTYKSGESLEDVILLRTNMCLSEWITQKDFEMAKNNAPVQTIPRNRKHSKTEMKGVQSSEMPASHLNKSLLMKIPTNTTIIGTNSLSISQNSILNSPTADEGKLRNEKENQMETGHSQNSQGKPPIKVIYNKAIDALHATGHCRGFIKGVHVNDNSGNVLPIFGVYCVKWKRSGTKEEYESKFVINGIEINEPPINIYCVIEEKMFVKIPMTLKIVLKNPTLIVLHLIVTLSNTDYFMCSGHKQLNVSIFSNSEKEVVFNLYPLKVGWQNLPDLTLEYNTQADPTKDELQKATLCQLVQRSMPKKVFVLPPSKQNLMSLK